jgi:potassium-dependent mechanosensitive channel
LNHLHHAHHPDNSRKPLPIRRQISIIFRLRFIIAITLLTLTTFSHAKLSSELTDRLIETDKLISATEEKLKELGIEIGIGDLKKLQDNAADGKVIITECIEINGNEISKIDSDSQSLGILIDEENIRVTEKRDSLNKIRSEHDRQLATCRLLNLRVVQIIEKVQNLTRTLVATQLLTRHYSVLKNIRLILDNPGDGFNALLEFSVSKAGFELVYEERFRLGFVILISLVLTFGIRYFLRKLISNFGHVEHRSFARLLSISIFSSLSHNLLSMLLSGSITILFLVIGFEGKNLPFFIQLISGLFLYSILIFIIRVVLDPIAPAIGITNLPPKLEQRLARRLRLLAKILLIGFLVFSAGHVHEFPIALSGLFRNFYITLVVLNLCWVFWLLGAIESLSNSRIIRSLIILALLASMVVEWLGFSNLSTFILVGISGSIVAWILAESLANLWTDFLDSFDDGEFVWQQYFRNKIGVQQGEYIPGSIWFRFIFSVVLWSAFTIVILKIWGLSDQGLLFIRSLVIEGFNAGPVHIVPSKVLTAILLFAVLLSLLGWLKRRLERSWLHRSRMDRGSKESLITLTGYIGIVFAFLIGLSVAGVELANLALIAGALSVGIGFGLQNVVNNFVSGIVLLFERPVKTGDWIVVGETQGYVKKIKLRSTILQTFDRADVIVPNSEFISSQVTNWMHNDSMGRVKVPIRVTFGTNPKLVEKLLLEIALQHPMVISQSLSVDPPRVLFMKFDDSALSFELRCFITDIDYCMFVLSDINFSIFEKFAEAGIEIPFPQSDLHIKSGLTKDLVNDPD